MGMILLFNIDTLATFDPERRVLKSAWILVRDGFIEAIGEGSPPFGGDRHVDLSGHVVLPGLIDSHQHHFQTLLRDIPGMQNASQYPWLRDLYRLMSELTDEDQYIASLVAQAELLLSGCTTSVDHSCLKVKDIQFDTRIRAARDMGIRFVLARGSFSLGEGRGGLPLGSVAEKEDDILADTERLIKAYHDPEPGAMVQVANAPCSPYSATPALMRESIELARKHGVHSHTRLAESPDDERFMQETYGRSSVEAAADWGWVGPDVWYANAVQVSPGDIELIAGTGTAVAHCPSSNMYLASGCCPVPEMLKKGVAVGLGIGGTASNHSSNMLAEVRNALLLQRVFYGAQAMSPTQALELATIGSARLLGREELGVLAPGNAADLIAISLDKLAFAGGLHDPVAALVLCTPGQVDLSMVAGQIRVQNGELLGVDLPALVKRGNELAAALVARTEKRYGVSLGRENWRRAFG